MNTTENKMKKQIIVNDNPIEWKKNLTIDKILRIMNYSFKMLVIKVDGKLIKKDEYGTKIVPENSDVKIIHLISGG